jgi:hypothetical protein
MKLDEYMKQHDLTDEGFGERIGKKRLTIFKYRHGLIVPGKDAMERIVSITEGRVTPNDFYASQPSSHG